MERGHGHALVPAAPGLLGILGMLGMLGMLGILGMLAGMLSMPTAPAALVAANVVNKVDMPDTLDRSVALAVRVGLLAVVRFRRMPAHFRGEPRLVLCPCICVPSRHATAYARMHRR
ncbi:MAG: hypothetical protein ACXWQR_06335 [Ktedonobacterales bacterium]